MAFSLCKPHLIIVIGAAFLYLYLSIPEDPCYEFLNSPHSENFKAFDYARKELGRRYDYYRDWPEEQPRLDSAYEEVKEAWDALSDQERRCNFPPQRLTLPPITKGKLYERAIKNYHATLRAVDGVGPRGQSYVDKAYEKLENAYEEMSCEEKKQWNLPKKMTLKGNGDPWSALAGAMANMR